MTSSLNTVLLEKALASLGRAIEPPPANDRERDGAIQRFEYSFELSWKVAQKVLANIGIVCQSPKAVIRELARQGMINSPEQWLYYLEKRNLTSHTYNEPIAQDVFLAAVSFLEDAKSLLISLKTQE